MENKKRAKEDISVINIGHLVATCRPSWDPNMNKLQKYIFETIGEIKYKFGSWDMAL